MTEEKDNEIKEEVKQESSVKEIIDESITATETTSAQTSSEGAPKSEELKKLEEKEHYELDYFSKEELVSKTQTLEKELDNLKESIKKLQKENTEWKNKYMKLQADFENAQKRWDKNRQNLRIEYTASVLRNFLPLYDSFKKAIDTDKTKESEKNLLIGFYNQFMNIFKSYGAEPIKVKINDPFDYSIHEALSTVEKEEFPENSIVEIIQDGFKYGKEVIRYAKVIISRKPKPPEPEPEPEEEKVEEEIKELDETQAVSSDKEEIKEGKPKEKKAKKEKKSKKKDE